MNFRQTLEHLNETIWSEDQACSEALEWIDDKTLEQAWNTCERPDWMFWLLKRLKAFDIQLHKISCDIAEDCVEKYWVPIYPDDKRPQEAIAAKRKWIKDPSEENAEALRSAWSAARAATWYAIDADDADATWYAADAAWAAARSAWSAARSAESADAAWAAARSAESAADAADTSWSAAADAKEQQCEIIRRYVTARMVREAMPV